MRWVSEMKKLIVMVFIGIIFSITCFTESAFAIEREDNTTDKKVLEEIEKQMDTYDFQQMDTFLNQNAEKPIRFVDVWKGLFQNNTKEQSKSIFQFLKKHIMGEINYQRGLLVKVAAIAVISAVFSTFAITFKNQQMNQTAFFVTYLMLLVTLIQTFRMMEQIAQVLLERICEFMNAFLPSFAIALGVSAGTQTAIGIYGIVLYAISIIQFIMLKVMLPMIELYVLLSLINCISKEDMFSRAVQLLESLIRWGNRTLFAAIIGINIVKNMILPSVDFMKNSMAQKIVSVIPGVGDGVEGVTGIMLGTGKIIKNTMGTAALIVLIFICIIPIIKILVCTFLYQLLSAVLQPITDRRIQKAIHSISAGGTLLFQSMMMVVLLFVIAIAIACVATNLT